MDVYAISLKIQAVGQKQVEAALNSVSKNLGITERAAKAAGLAITGAFAGALVLGIKNMMEAEKSLAQLTATVKSTGGAAGFTAQELVEMSKQASRASLASAEDIQSAQVRLLTYTKVTGNVFREAQAVAIDMAQTLGISLTSAAETVGRALNYPSQSLGGLIKQGFRFTDSQVALIKKLEETGRMAEAQRIIIDELNESYKGSAEAASNTFAGALKKLNSAFGNLVQNRGVFDTARVLVEKTTQNLKTLARTAVVAAALIWAQFFIPMVVGLANLTRGLTLATIATRAFNASIALMGGPAAAAIKLGILAVGAAYIAAGASADKAREQFDKANESLATMSQGQLEVRLKEQLSKIEELKKELTSYEGAGNVWMPFSVPARLKKQIEDLQAAASETGRALRAVRLPRSGGADGPVLGVTPVIKAEDVDFDRWMTAGYIAFAKQMKEAADRRARHAENKKPLELMVPVQPKFDVAQFDSFFDNLRREGDELEHELRLWSEGVANSVADAFAMSLERAAASGRLSEGWKALGAGLLGGLGTVLVEFGKKSMMASTLMKQILDGIGRFMPQASFAAGLALVALGSAMRGTASNATVFGSGRGGGGGVGFAGAGGMRFDDTFTRVTYGPTNASTAAGMQPRAAMNVTVIGPNDPQAQRQIQELISKGARR